MNKELLKRFAGLFIATSLMFCGCQRREPEEDSIDFKCPNNTPVRPLTPLGRESLEIAITAGDHDTYIRFFENPCRLDNPGIETLYTSPNSVNVADGETPGSTFNTYGIVKGSDGFEYYITYIKDEYRFVRIGN